MRSRAEIQAYHDKLDDRYKTVLRLWGKVQSEIMNGNAFVVARYNNAKRDSIERWIASAGGAMRTMRWTLGLETFGTALSMCSPEDVTDLRLTNDWGKDGDKRVAPLGPIPEDINGEHTPSRQLRPDRWVNFMYHHMVAVHREIFMLHKYHPGMWHPQFMQRVVNTLMWMDGSIRVLEWTLQKCNAEKAFYQFEGDVLEQLEKALTGAVQFDQGLLTRYDVAADDHDPDGDFGTPS